MGYASAFNEPAKSKRSAVASGTAVVCDSAVVSGLAQVSDSARQ